MRRECLNIGEDIVPDSISKVNRRADERLVCEAVEGNVLEGSDKRRGSREDDIFP